MAQNANNVGVAYDGEVSIGPTTATAPTGTGGALTGFTGLGFLSEDSFTIKPETKADDIKAWQRAQTVRSIITESKVTIEFTCIETTKAVLEAFFGQTVTQTATEGTVKIDPSKTGGKKSLVIDVIDGANLERWYFHTVEMSERKEIKGSTKDAEGWGMTFTAFADGTGSVGTYASTRLKTGA